MNIQVQCCGLAILLLLFYFYTRQKRVGLFSETVFLKELLMTVLCLVLDILSIIAIYYRSDLPQILLDLACKAYLISISWVGYGSLMYILTDLYPESEYPRAIRWYTRLALLTPIVVLVTPIAYHDSADGTYTYGMSVMLTYVVALFFVLYGIYTMLRYGSRMNPKRRSAVLIWYAIWMLVSCIQFFTPSLLIVGFGMAIGMMILFISLENPETNMDRQFGCFNASVLLRYMNQCYDREIPFSLVLVSFPHSQQKQDDKDRYDDALRTIALHYAEHPDIHVFKRVEQELVLVLPLSISTDAVVEQIERLIGEDLPQPAFCIIDNSDVAENADRIYHLMNYFKNRLSGSHRIVHIDKTVAEESYHIERMRQEIIEALDEDRVEAFFQPIYGVAAKRFVSAEALARIRRRDGGYLSPGAFIPVAEETGLIIPLGRRIFEKTCQMIQAGCMERYGLSYIEVNLSVIQCEQQDLAGSYIEIIHRYGIDPHYINLEITETASIQIKQNLLENMKELMKFGVTFSLDDFGNGQSNLDYVIDMPVSILKMDQNMTKSYFEKERARIAVEATLRMVHEMQLHMVSEGVETKEQLDSMIEAGVDYIQGYYFSKPLPESDFLAFLEKNIQK